MDCAWFEGRSVHFSVVVAGVLGDVLDGVDFGYFEGSVDFLSFAGIGVYILARSNGSGVSATTLKRIAHVHR